MPKAVGGQTCQTKSTCSKEEQVENNEPKALPELGISRKESSTWQKLADVPEDGTYKPRWLASTYVSYLRPSSRRHNGC
jgi:hypothetical protein